MKEINDEMNFRDLVLKIWDEKQIIFSFLAISLLLSVVYVSSVKEVFQTQVDFKLAFISEKKISRLRLENFFYDKIYFDKWQESSSNKFISYSDISLKDEGGIFFNDDQEAFFEKDSDSLIIKSNDPQKILSYYDYLIFLDSMIKEEVIRNLKIKIKLYDNSISKATNNNVIFPTNFIENLRNEYDLLILKSENIFKFYPPTKPKKIEPKKTLTIILAALIGLILGLLTIFIKETFSRK